MVILGRWWKKFNSNMFKIGVEQGRGYNQIGGHRVILHSDVAKLFNHPDWGRQTGCDGMHGHDSEIALRLSFPKLVILSTWAMTSVNSLERSKLLPISKLLYVWRGMKEAHTWTVSRISNQNLSQQEWQTHSLYQWSKCSKAVSNYNEVMATEFLETG